jgi:NADH dehydrogenase FAD-containing subunit
MSTSTTDKVSAQRHVVVIGAGYAGLSAAERAGGGRGGANRVTVIAPEARFANRIRQHEVAAGRRIPGAALADLARKHKFTHIQARVTELDLAGHKVFTDAGEAIDFDVLVYALGSRTGYRGVEGAAERAIPMERAGDLRDRIAGAARPGTVAVVGGGATGIELAAELARSRPDWQVRIVTSGEVGGWFSARGRAAIARRFEQLGIHVHERTEVTAVDADGLRTTAGPIEADVVAWAASFEVPELAAQAGFAVDGSGRIVVDAMLRSVSHPDVYAIGDAAAVTMGEVPGVLRMACATAMPMGLYVGKTLRAQADSRAEAPTKPYEFGFTLQCLSLGRDSGLIQLLRRDDTVKERAYTGRAAKIVKSAICGSVGIMLR